MRYGEEKPTFDSHRITSVSVEELEGGLKLFLSAYQVAFKAGGFTNAIFYPAVKKL